MGRLNDLTGQTFGKLKVIEYLGNRKWKCECQCENKTIRIVGGYDLTSGNTKSCGCSRNKPKIGKDLTGQTFGRLTVKEYVGNSKYKCVCSCGSGKEIIVASSDLKSGHTQSCGCLHTEIQHKAINETIGKTFGEWKVLSYAGDGYFNCECSCKTTRKVLGYSLRSGESKSCGHIGSKSNFIDLTGKQFGNWVVQRYAGENYWTCECQCESKTIKDVAGSSLVRGISKSCGCLTEGIRREAMLERYGDIVPGKHRDLELIELVNDRDKFTEFILSEYSKEEKLINVIDLVDKLNINKTNILRKIHAYGLEEYINLNNFKSNKEDELFDLIYSIDSYTLRRDRKTLNGKELDIYLPNKKLAIEFNGDYWHSYYMVGMEYHQNKSIEALEKGVEIIHIFENEWDDETINSNILKYLEKRIKNTGYIINKDKIEIEHVQNADQNILIREFISRNKLYNIDIDCNDLQILFIDNEILGVALIKNNEVKDIVINLDYNYEDTLEYMINNLENISSIEINMSKYPVLKFIKNKYEITEPRCILKDSQYEVYDAGRIKLFRGE